MVMVGCDCVREVVRWMKRTELDGEYGGNGSWSWSCRVVEVQELQKCFNSGKSVECIALPRLISDCESLSGEAWRLGRLGGVWQVTPYLQFSTVLPYERDDECCYTATGPHIRPGYP
jgi:hypothetical protein